MPLLTLGLGSNIGDRLAMLRLGVEALVEGGVLTGARLSKVYESAAFLPEGAPSEWDMPFLNMAVAGETILAPEQILVRVKQIEQQLGRTHRGHWGPREIDIDLLLLEGVELHTPALTLPHPRILERPFVLWPLADIHPHWGAAVEALEPLHCVGDLAL
jgi:2-amino-4-hydroxy-6-hydroxymethyldihydropteridine diphosphokinase